MGSSMSLKIKTGDEFAVFSFLTEGKKINLEEKNVELKIAN